ncbi:MAG: hypothetical protein Barrevirus1_48 [Barrevirus sp.]|uniref:Uncharacterized protein n=1 Tax=Barrevirus sp. TaxID=2487763 RepID=A0A3G4ZPK9_9VIRU|nr:MAG: hypothetical protein Barrevirus1_48 [Barrevirus sp.]
MGNSYNNSVKVNETSQLEIRSYNIQSYTVTKDNAKMLYNIDLPENKNIMISCDNELTEFIINDLLYKYSDFRKEIIKNFLYERQKDPVIINGIVVIERTVSLEERLNQPKTYIIDNSTIVHIKIL